MTADKIERQGHIAMQNHKEQVLTSEQMLLHLP